MKIQQIVSALINLASIVSSLLILSGFLLPGAALWILGYATVLWRQFQLFSYLQWQRLQPTQLVTRVSFMFGIAGALLHIDRNGVLAGWIALTIAILLPRLTRSIADISRGTNFDAHNLPGLTLPKQPQSAENIAAVSTLLLPPVLLLATLTQLSGWILLTITLIPTILVFGGIVRMSIWRASRSRLASQLSEVMSNLRPSFVVYWNAPVGSKFHLSMWLPYLKRVKLPFFILVRNKDTFQEAIEASEGAPVIWARTLTDVDSLLYETLTTVFYTNNSDKNTHMVRHLHLRHIQLLHGDSEKTPSFNPVTSMYDKVYVAGQAAIDRYADHGISIPRHKFEIVGRPQVEQVSRDDSHIGQKTSKTVLYAPTWNGYFRDTAYSSLPIVSPLITQLLNDDVRVIFRPHPYSYKDPALVRDTIRIQNLLRDHRHATGKHHLWGHAAETEKSLNQCFNEADAMLADVSSVITDFVYSGKPLGILTGEASPAETIGQWKLAEGAYIFSDDAKTWELQLGRLLHEDPLLHKRHELRSYYLGDFEPEGYGEHFVEAARRDILRHEIPSGGRNTHSLK